MSNEYSCWRPSRSNSCTRTGSIRGLAVNAPNTPELRSSRTAPTSDSGVARRADCWRLGSSSSTCAPVSGRSTAPSPNSGWPKASTRSPSTQVTVPVAVMSTSPRASFRPIAEPGSSGGDGAGDLPGAGALDRAEAGSGQHGEDLREAERAEAGDVQRDLERRGDGRRSQPRRQLAGDEGGDAFRLPQP